MLSSASLSAQLPHQLSTQEIPLSQTYQPQGSDLGIPVPPDFEVRTPAEWEEAEAIMIVWTSFTTILREIVREAKEDATVVIVCSNPAQVSNFLMQGGVDTENVLLLEENFNSIWCRDFGQWSIYREDVGELSLVDWIYNRPRPADDQVPQAIAELYELEMYETTETPYDLIHTGGNFMTDGLGQGFSSDLIIEENPDKNEAQIDAIMNEFMGISSYIKMPTLPYDEIHHIDMHMKLVNEETIFVSQYPEGVADGPQIEANIAEVVANHNSYFGTAYRIVPIIAPPDAQDRYPDEGGHYRTYTNSVFINKTLLVPVYDAPTDEAALNLYREHLPGYNVVGIDCNQIIPALGALHCITKLVHSDDPLLIVHQQKRESVDEEIYQIEARIQHESGISSATVYYRNSENEVFETTQMFPTDIENNMWMANVPLHFNGTQLDYFIQANASSGKSQFRPITAPEGFYSFEIQNAINDSSDLMVSGLNVLGDIKGQLNVYPNPANDFLNIELSDFDFLQEESVRMSVSDLTGREIKVVFEGNLSATQQKLRINIQDLQAGIYLLNLELEAGVLSTEIVVE